MGYIRLHLLKEKSKQQLSFKMVTLASRTLDPAFWATKETFYKGKLVCLLKRQQVRTMGELTYTLSSRC